jgi:glycosyltransferase involved in cell wall biosynthesis
MNGRTLLILQDSQHFGGHEAMFLRFLPALVDSGRFDRIVMRHPAGNAKLAERMAPFASDRFEIRGWGHVKQRAEPYMAGFRRHYARAVRSLIAAERPAATLLLQGRIENCAVPMLAAPRDAFLVSYVPMAHRMIDIGRRAMPGDWVRRRLYGRPDRFIVPGQAVIGQIAAAGGRAPVVVADNVVDPPPRADPRAARRALGLPEIGRIALFLGRLDVQQKGLDTLLAAIERQAERLHCWTFLFVGEGEGEEACAALKARVAGRLDIRCIPWTDKPHEALSAADAMLMPSRWEGVPLVMLEAMTYGLPILASDIDVFRDYLPERNRIDFATADLADALSGVTALPAIDTYRREAARRLGEQNIGRSSARFVGALLPQGETA